MTNKEMEELIEISQNIGFTQARVADLMGITSVYWYKIRKGKMPVSGEVLTQIRILKKKMKAFVAA